MVFMLGYDRACPGTNAFKDESNAGLKRAERSNSAPRGNDFACLNAGSESPVSAGFTA